MIDYITGASTHLYVSAGGTSLPYIASSNNPIQGMVRCINQRLEVYDGSAWIQLYSTTATIGMNNTAEQAITWAMNKMLQEQGDQDRRKEAERLAQTNVTIADALAKVKEVESRINPELIEAREQLEALVTLVKQEPVKVLA